MVEYKSLSYFICLNDMCDGKLRLYPIIGRVDPPSKDAETPTHICTSTSPPAPSYKFCPPLRRFLPTSKYIFFFKMFFFMNRKIRLFEDGHAFNCT